MRELYIRPDVSFSLMAGDVQTGEAQRIRLFWNFGSRAATLLIDPDALGFLNKYIGGTEHFVMDQFVTQEVSELVSFLNDRQLLSPWPRQAKGRWSRQLPVWSVLHPNVNPATTQRRIAEARVAILGLGGIGSNFAQQIHLAGVDHLLLLDADDIDESNLNRQIPYRTKDIGRPKIGVLKEQLLSSRPHYTDDIKCVDGFIDLQTLNATRAFKPDLVVIAADEPSVQQNLLLTLPAMGDVPVLVGGGYYGLNCFAGPLLAPDSRPCDLCLESYLLPAGSEARHRSVGGSLISLAVMAVSISTISALQLLSGQDSSQNPLVNQIVQFSAQAMATEKISLPIGDCCTVAQAEKPY